MLLDAISFREVLLAIVLPAVVGAIALAVALMVAWHPWKHAAVPRDATDAGDAGDAGWGGAVAIGLGFIVSYVAVNGWPSAPPAERWQWIVPLAALAVLVGVTHSLASRRGPIGGAAAAILLGAGAALMMRLPAMDSAPARIGLGLAIALTTVVMDPLAERRRGVSVPIGWTIAATALAVVLWRSHNAKLASLAAAIGAICLLATLVAVIVPRFSLARGGVAVIATLLTTLGACGLAYDYADLPHACFVLPVLAVPMLWFGEAPLVTRRGPWQAGLIRLVLVAAPCVTAVALA